MIINFDNKLKELFKYRIPFLQKFANKNSFHSFACKRKTLKNERNYSCFYKIYFINPLDI